MRKAAKRSLACVAAHELFHGQDAVHGLRGIDGERSLPDQMRNRKRIAFGAHDEVNGR